MTKMFQNENFKNYTFEEIPLNKNQDIKQTLLDIDKGKHQCLQLADERYRPQYEKMMLSYFEGGEYRYFNVLNITTMSKSEDAIELNWFPNYIGRYHEIKITLPRKHFVDCVGTKYPTAPIIIFVEGSWLESIFLRYYSIFALIDATGVKKALAQGAITREKLIKLRAEIDTFSENYPNISFISFADNILLKSNWSVGNNNYDPEAFIHLSGKINSIFQTALGLSTYAVITQGSNEYYDDQLLHISKSKNHISLNSLGIPFAQLFDIDETAKEAIRSNKKDETKGHPPAELYMDEHYFHSLNHKYGFDKRSEANNSYGTKIQKTHGKYYYSSRSNILSTLTA